MAKGPQRTTLSPAMGVALQIVAGIAGASVLFAALASFVGWQYLRSYYEALGIPFSVLSFSTQDYLFATLPTVVFSFSGVAGAAVGLVLGLLFPLPATLKGYYEPIGQFYGFARRMGGVYWDVYWTIIDKLPGLPVPDATRRLVRATLVAPAALVLVIAVIFYVILLLTLAFLLLGAWLTTEFGREIGNLILAMGLVSFAVSFVGTSLVRRADGPRKSIYLAITSAVSVSLLLSVIVFVPGRIGTATAENDSRDRDPFVSATIVITGRFGMAGERAISLDGSIVSQQQRCEEFVPGKEPPSPVSLCEVSQVVVIVHNNGFYFISEDADIEASQRRIYPVPDDRVVRIIYEPQRRLLEED